jgi:hypothetical protein
LWATDRPEWQLSATAPTLIWDAGPDTAFLVTAAIFSALTALTVVLCRSLHTLQTDVRHK